MKLSDAYELDIFQKYIKKRDKDLSDLSNIFYISNITLEFSGIANIKINIGDICIEKARAKDKYHVKNFRVCPYPNGIYENLNIICDVPYEITFFEHVHDALIRSIIIYKGVYYKLIKSPKLLYKYIIMKNAELLFTNKKTYDIGDKYIYNLCTINNTGLQSYDFPDIINIHNWLKKYAVPSFGQPYSIMAVSELNNLEVPIPTIFIPKKYTAFLIKLLNKKYPNTRIELTNISATKILKQNKDIVFGLIKLLKKKRSKCATNISKEFVDMTEIIEI